MSGVRGLSVIDVAAIAEAAAVTESVFRDDGVGVVHEAGGFAPAALIEIAGCAVVVAGVRNVAAMRGAADMARLVSAGDEVGDQRPEPVRKVAGHRYRSGCGGHCDNAAATSARQGRVCYASMVNLGGVPVGVVVPVMVMGGLGLGGAQGKECCRYQQSHTQYLFSCCSVDALPGVSISSAALCGGVGGTSISGGRFPELHAGLNISSRLKRAPGAAERNNAS